MFDEIELLKVELTVLEVLSGSTVIISILLTYLDMRKIPETTWGDAKLSRVLITMVVLMPIVGVALYWLWIRKILKQTE